MQQCRDFRLAAVLCGDQQSELRCQCLTFRSLTGGPKATHLHKGVVQEVGVAMAGADESVDGVSPGIR